MLFARGTEPIPDATVDHAETNVAEFIRDVLIDVDWPSGQQLRETDIGVARLTEFDSEGRFAFALTVPTPTGEGLTLTALIPGLPLEQVDFGARPGDHPTSFPRVYLDGASWLWRNAVAVAATRVAVALRAQG